MILADTSVWVHHLRTGDETLSELLGSGQVLMHPFIVGEIALGHLRQRETVLASLRDLPQANVATPSEVLWFVEGHVLAGAGIGYVDVHLLAATRLTDGLRLWTRDKRLSSVAKRIDVSWYDR